MLKDKFCKFPFEHFDVNSKGVVFICCPSRVPLPVGNILENELNDIWNSEAAQKIRESIFDGTFKYCVKNFCPSIQRNLLPKKANIKEPYFKDIIAKRQVVLEKGPLNLNLSYDRTCNLACPTCRSHHVRLKGKDIERARLIHERIFKSSMLKNVKMMFLSGSGDPFASAIYMDLFRSLNTDEYPDLKITIMTNGLLFTPEIWKSIANIHKAVSEVNVSIDAATPETYKTNRGGNFSKLMNNLEFIKTLRESGMIDKYRISFVVQKNNYKEMKQFIQLGMRMNCDMTVFSKIARTGSSHMENYEDRAIHLKTHPEYDEFKKWLKSPIFKEKIVYLSNLASILSEPDFESVGNSLIRDANFRDNSLSHWKNFNWNSKISIKHDENERIGNYLRAERNNRSEERVISQRGLPIKPNTCYMLKFKARMVSGPGKIFAYLRRVEDGKNIGVPTRKVGSTGWELCKAFFTVGDGVLDHKAGLFVDFVITGNKNTADIANVTIFEQSMVKN